MDYLTIKEADEKQGICRRKVSFYCEEGPNPDAALRENVQGIRVNAGRTAGRCYLQYRDWSKLYHQEKN